MTLSSEHLRQNQKPLLVFGAGGHGRVVADAALLQSQWSGVVATARSLPAHLTVLLPGINLVDFDTVSQADTEIHIAIGNNAAREAEAQALGQQLLVSVIHPQACVSAFSQMGAGCFVAAGAVVAPLAVIGMGVIVNHGAVIDHDTDVGDFSHIAQRACVCGHARLGRRVLIGSGAVVLSSVVLGDDVVLSPGSVAGSNLLSPGIYSGNPAVKTE